MMNECNKDAFRHKKRRLMKELAFTSTKKCIPDKEMTSTLCLNI